MRQPSWSRAQDILLNPLTNKPHSVEAAIEHMEQEGFKVHAAEWDENQRVLRYGWVDSHDSVDLAFDPTGQDKKFDGDKVNPVGMFLEHFPRAVKAIASLTVRGESKYKPTGWKTTIDGETRYQEAEMRHLLDRLMGEETDPESGYEHIIHQAWNVLAVLEHYCQKHDIYGPGKQS